MGRPTGGFVHISVNHKNYIFISPIIIISASYVLDGVFLKKTPFCQVKRFFMKRPVVSSWNILDLHGHMQLTASDLVLVKKRCLSFF